jgi:hypothetical protein
MADELPGACRRRRADRKKRVVAFKGGAREPFDTRYRQVRLEARPRLGEPSQALSAGSPIRCRFLDPGSSATHQRACGSNPRIRV